MFAPSALAVVSFPLFQACVAAPYPVNTLRLSFTLCQRCVGKRLTLDVFLDHLDLMHFAASRAPLSHGSFLAFLGGANGVLGPLQLLSPGYFYMGQRNRTNVQHKLAFRKYDPVVNQHVLFVETKKGKRR